MEKIPHSVIEDVRTHCDIVDVVGEYVELRRTGETSFRGQCPFHNEKTPSLQVDAVRQFYHCFGCGKEGDVFCFIMNKEGMTFYDAVIFLAARAGIIIPEIVEDSEENKTDVSYL